MPDQALRDSIISAVRNYASSSIESKKAPVPLSDWYDAVNGGVQGFANRPVVGGHLAVMLASSGTVAGSNTTASLPPSPSSPSKSSGAQRVGPSLLVCRLSLGSALSISLIVCLLNQILVSLALFPLFI
jgi:hypothetical protein